MGIINAVLTPIYTAVSWVMVTFHSLWSAIGLPEDSGVTWGLSILGLVVVIRIILIPLFVKQIKAQRGMQVLQPQMKEIQKKYKNNRERQSQEMMKLYKETGTNPLSSCLPLLAQSPIFFGLFHVLNQVARSPDNPPGVFTKDLAESASNATLFGAPLSETFLGAGTGATKAVIAVMVLLMSATMFFTQKQLMSKNMPASAMNNPFAQQQKLLLYIMPLIFLFSGLGFPIGVLLYWLTSNIWTAGQQFYVIRRNPTPGSQADVELQARRAKRGSTPASSPTTTGPDQDSAAPSSAAPVGGQRQQPKRPPRGKRSGTRPAQPDSPTRRRSGEDEPGSGDVRRDTA